MKAKRKTNLYYAEKEYLQYIFLHAISRFADSFVFKGGTCLRICYGFERASEDLKFSTVLDIGKTRKIVKECMNDFRLLGIDYEVYAEKEHEGNIRFEGRFKGPLYSGHSSSTNTLKIEFSRRKSRYKEARAIPKLFSDIPVFTIMALETREILAEKIRALINRNEPKDLYDVWMLLQNNVRVDSELLSEKLKEEKCTLEEIKFPAKEAYETELKNLLIFLPPYAQVKREVVRTLKNMHKSL